MARLRRDRVVAGVGLLVAVLGAASPSSGGPLAPVCGNGALEAGEECDDGNALPGDGCSASCLIEGPLGAAQQACVNAVNGSFAAAIDAAGKAASACAKSISKGKLASDLGACLAAADFSASEAAALRADGQKCAAKGVEPASTFAYRGSPQDVVAAALDDTLGGFQDLLGRPASIAPKGAKAAARCQQAVVAGFAKYLGALARETNARKKASLGDAAAPALSSLDLQADLAGAPAGAKPAKALAAVGTQAGRRCAGQDLAALFPGTCANAAGDAAALTECGGGLARCRFCRALDEADRLRLDCAAYSAFAGCAPAVCGDGTVEIGEACDDGNTANGDGCRADCTVEVCGDGIQDPQEECDDGNTVPGDGCGATCLVEACPPEGCGNPFLAGTVDAHNQVRAAHGVGPLTWDSTLAAIAQAWADQCVDVDAPAGLLDHNPDRSASYGSYVGENIYASSGQASGTDAVAAWASEEASYDYATNTCNGVCGHYTQVVWATTTKVGCGISTCPGLTYSSSIVCDYAPGGNIDGMRPY